MHIMHEPEHAKERPVVQTPRESTRREVAGQSENRSAAANPSSRSPDVDLEDRSRDRTRRASAGEDRGTSNLAWAEPTARLFEDLRRGFDAAMTERADSVRENFLAVAGSPVHLRVIGRDLADHLLKPWRHLIIPQPTAPSPVLSIDVWDENATQIRCQVRDPAASSRMKLASSPDGRFRAQQSSHTLSCLDQEGGRLISSVVWDDRVPSHEWSRPLIVPLIYWSEAQGVGMVHAGLVSLFGSGILLPGMSGAGKSTAALGCAVGGHGFLGDDLVGVQCLRNGEYLGHSLHASISIAAHHLDRFPVAARYAIPLSSPGSGKLLVAMWEAYPHLLQRSVRIQAVAIPRVSGQRVSRLRPAAKRDALIALGVGSLLLIPGNDGHRLKRLSEMIEQLPCYWLELGSDIESIARCAEAIFEGRTP